MATVFKRTPKGKYYAEYTGRNGKRIRRSTGTTVKQDAQKIATKWELDENAIRQGIAKDAPDSLTELLDEYLIYLSNSGDKHLQVTESRMRAILKGTAWETVADVNQFDLETFVRSYEYFPSKKGPGRKLSLRTQGHYLGVAKSFVSWLVNVRNAMSRSPLTAIRKPNFAADRKIVRRFLLPAEWPWLATTPNALLYETAIQTGFRASEIRAIQSEHLGADHIYLPARSTKNRKDAKQYITPSLRKRLVGRLPFDLPSNINLLAEMVRADLANARAAALKAKHKPASTDIHFLSTTNALGHVMDFHALRHTCGAWLAIRGVNPKVIQAVMRHSSIALTLDTYGHLLPGAEQDAVKHFDSLLSVDLSQVSGTT